ncbi:MAG: MraY family glycosyltransferase [Candidatus Sumerlaeota bacterium]|nr:MraY family glycosyltransferase [Candidatus Sumerlaeota bacterium]
MFWLCVYSAILIQTFVAALAFTPLARKWAWRWGLVDHPGERKVHWVATPRSGGGAIYAAFVGSLLVDFLIFALLVHGDFEGERLAPYRANLIKVAPGFIAILAGLTMVFALGFIDDRRPLGPLTKLAGQILAVMPLLFTGVRIDLFLHNWLPAPLAWVGGALLTIAWVTLLTNAMNFLDNMDGLAGGVGCVISLVLAGFSVMHGHVFMTIAYLALAGALLGFLRYNWRPASIFMGDSGSLTIGYALAALTINSRFYEAAFKDDTGAIVEAGARTGLAVLIPLIVMGVPIFDTVSVVFIRWRRGAPLMKGDTNHLSHRLVALGFSKPQAVAFICVLTLVTALMALPLRYLPLAPALLHIAGVGALFVLIFIMERVARRKVEK